MAGVLLVAAIPLVIWLRVRWKTRHSRQTTPLAGYDTGLRHPGRAPRGLINNRRGL